jgi:hypothetical protein
MFMCGLFNDVVSVADYITGTTTKRLAQVACKNTLLVLYMRTKLSVNGV